MRTYGFKGNKHAEDPTRCAVTVFDRVYGGRWFQCRRKRGYGVGGLLCVQHAKLEVKGVTLRIPADKEVPT